MILLNVLHNILFCVFKYINSLCVRYFQCLINFDVFIWAIYLIIPFVHKNQKSFPQRMKRVKLGNMFIHSITILISAMMQKQDFFSIVFQFRPSAKPGQYIPFRLIPVNLLKKKCKNVYMTLIVQYLYCCMLKYISNYINT